MLSSLFASLSAKLTAVAFAATAAAGGIAATGDLPEPAQTAVATAVEKIGIHIPNPGDASADHRRDAEHRQDDGAGEQSEGAGKSVSEDVKDAIDDTEPSLERGEAVSEAASQNRANGAEPQGQPTDVPSVSPTTPDGNPTGYGQDSHPDGNSTGYGQDSHPDGNPTGFGTDH